MADYFMSVVNTDQLNYIGDTTADMTVGTSSTAGDKIELRFDQGTTRFQVIKALEKFIRRLKNGGDCGISDGANMGNP
jgi:hypothetical protein